MRQRTKQLAAALTIGAVGGAVVRIIQPKKQMRKMGRTLHARARQSDKTKRGEYDKKDQ